MPDFVIKQNDTRPYLEAQLLDATGAPFNLTDCTVRFLMAKVGVAQAKVNADCSVVDAEQGTVRYIWQSGDTSESGSYQAEFEVTLADGSKQTVPNDGYLQITVIKELG